MSGTQPATAQPPAGQPAAAQQQAGQPPATQEPATQQQPGDEPSLKSNKHQGIKTDLKIESKPVQRRLSSPYHGLPSVVGYDEETGYVTFGQTIPIVPPVVHPRRFVEPSMPLEEHQRGICKHLYCLTERRRLYGLSVPSTPVGLPWSTGLLRYLPGHRKIEFVKKKKQKKKKKKSLNFGEDESVVDEIIYFYKILMLAGSVISEARKEMDLKSEKCTMEEEEKATVEN